MINLISNDKKVQDIVQAIHIQDTFLFTYNICEKVRVNGDYPNPGHDINNFKAGAKVAIEFQVNSRNFKANKKIDVMKAYLFYLLGVYLVDDLNSKTMSTPEKWDLKDNE